MKKNKELLNYDARKEIIILWRLYNLPRVPIANKRAWTLLSAAGLDMYKQGARRQMPRPDTL